MFMSSATSASYFLEAESFYHSSNVMTMLHRLLGWCSTNIGLEYWIGRQHNTPCPDKKGASDFVVVTFTNIDGFS